MKYPSSLFLIKKIKEKKKFEYYCYYKKNLLQSEPVIIDHRIWSNEPYKLQDNSLHTSRGLHQYFAEIRISA